MKKIILLISLFIFSFSLCEGQSWLWERSTLGIACNVSVASDDNGNCFQAGFMIRDTVSFGTDTLRDNSNNYDAFIVKYSPAGNVIWAKQSEQKGNRIYSNGYTITTDKDGNAYLMANLMDTLIFDSDTLKTQGSGFPDTYLVKFDANGTEKWARESSVPSPTSFPAGNYSSTDANGNTYITGFFMDTVSFGNDTLKCLIDSAGDTFLTKYDVNGNEKWARQSAGFSPYGSEARFVAANNSGKVFIAGVFSDSVTFGNYKLTTVDAYNYDMFVVSYDTNGKVLWGRQAVIPSSASGVWCYGITVDNAGNVYVSGSFIDTVVFGTDTLINNASNYAWYALPYMETECPFIVKYNALGEVVWTFQPKILDHNRWFSTSLSSDCHGNIYYIGDGGLPDSLCKIAFQSDILSLIDTSYFDVPLYMIKMDTSGNVNCATIIRCGGTSYSNMVSSDTSGNYVYLGANGGTVQIFGSDTLNPFKKNSMDASFVARWNGCDNPLYVNNIILDEIKIIAFPNPSNGTFTLQTSGAQNFSSATIEIYNVLGERVKSEELRAKSEEIDLTGQPNGIYLYRVLNEDGTLLGQGKIVVEK